MKNYFLIGFSVLLSMCRTGSNSQYQEEDITDDYVIAEFSGQHILISEVDKLARQELYDELYRIYIIRKSVLNELINCKLIETEAGKYNKTADQYLDDYYNMLIIPSSIAKFTQQIDLQYIPELKRGLKYYDTASVYGKELILQNYKKYLRENLIDSLRLINKVKVYLKPPLSPEMSLNKVVAHYRGNMDSRIMLIEVSDMECDKCREYFPVYEEIYTKYQDKVKFGFTHFASYVTLSALTTECAGKQDKFWEMHDSLMQRKTLPDTAQVFDLAKKIKLNMGQFRKDFTSFEVQNKIENNFKILKACGLYATPTILINNKPVFNSSSPDEIEKVLDSLLLSD